MSQPQIQAVAFDLDGLMINSEELYRESGSEMIRRRGKNPEEAVFHAMMGKTNADALRVFKDWYGFDDSAEALNQESEALMDALMAERLDVMPGLKPLLDALELAKIPKAVTTSGTRKHLDRVLSQLSMTERFQFVLTAENVTRGKPNPEMYLLAAKQFGVKPKKMMVLEDSNHGSTAGVAAGAVVVAVPTEFTGTVTANVELVAKSLADPRIYELIGLSS